MKPEKKQIAISDDAKVVFDLLKKMGKMPLNELKAQSDMSNKKWDTAIKELTGLDLVKVVKTDTSLDVEVV